MKRDRLRNDKAEIHNLEDLIGARQDTAGRSGGDTDALADIDIPDSLDVDEALTFPHPKRKKEPPIDLMDTPHEDEMDEDWDAQDIQPTDYSHDYDEATTTDPSDDEDVRAEERVHEIAHPAPDQVTDTPTIEVMPSKFTPDEETG